MKYAILLAGLLLLAIPAYAQTVNCNSAHDTVSIPGTALTVSCPASNTPPVTPPVTPPPSTGCSAAQLSTPINGKTLQRQCAGVVYMQPTSATYSGALTELGTVLGNKTFPNYSYIGASPTLSIQPGYYVSLAFTPTTAGYIQWTANTSYGDGGTISLSTVPGALAKGSAGVICTLAFNGLNSLYVSTAASASCKVTQGQTYYINFADVDGSGNPICNGSSGCASAYVSYTLYGRAL